MYDGKSLLHILTCLEAIEKIRIYTTGFEEASEFFSANDQMNFNACRSLLLVIGEETKKIDERLKPRFKEIPWEQIEGLRNRLAHDYRGSDPEVLFSITSEELPKLKQALLAMMKLIDIDKDALGKALGSSFYRHLDYLKKSS